MQQISVKVKTGSKLGPLIEAEANGDLTVYLRERPERGNANLALIKLLAKHYDIPKSRIEIVRGLTSNHKILRLYT